MLLLYILFTVYILAVNFYAVLLVKAQRDESCGDEAKMNAGDGKLLLAAILGGAIAVYVTMFILKYRLKNILLMIILPIIGVLNVYIFVIAYRSGFTFFVT